MSRYEWFEEMRKIGSTEQHVDQLVTDNLLLVTMVEDPTGNDLKEIEHENSAVLRYAVVNRTHRTINISFRTRSDRRALIFSESRSNTNPYQVTCSFKAYPDREHQTVPIVFEDVVHFEVDSESQNAQDVLLTNPSCSIQNAKNEIIERTNEERMINTVLIAQKDWRNIKETAMSKDFVNALGEGVVTLLGPLGAPIKVMLELYNDEKLEQRNQKLEQLIDTNKTINEAVLAEIFEVRENQMITHSVFVHLMQALLQEMAQQQTKNVHSILRQVDLQLESDDSKILSEKNLISELRYLFPDKDTFVNVLQESNYPVDNLKLDKSIRTIINDFVKDCRGKNFGLLCTTFHALYSEKGEAVVVREAAGLYCEAMSN